MTDLTLEHRGGWRRCPCGDRHTREHLIYLTDQRARALNDGREPDHGPVDLPVRRISSAREDVLQRIVRLHGPNPQDARACLAPSCGDSYPCAHRRSAVAELLAAGIAPWTPQ